MTNQNKKTKQLKGEHEKKVRPFWFYIFHPDHVLLVGLTLLFLKSLTVVLSTLSFLNPVERSLENFRMTDVFYDIYRSGEQTDTTDLITIVDITDVFDRGRLAETLMEICDEEPAALGVDIIFEGKRDDAVGNALLQEAVQHAIDADIPVVWARKLDKWDGEQERFTADIHSFFADSLSVTEGFVNTQNALNGSTLRTFGTQRRIEDDIAYSLPVQLVLAFNGDSSMLNRKRDINIRYTETHFPVVDCNSISEHSDLIKGHIVLLGAKSDPRDMHYTPLGLIPGIDVLAYTVQTIVERKMPKEPTRCQTIMIAFFLMWLVQVSWYFIHQRMLNSRFGLLRIFGECDFTESLIAVLFTLTAVGVSFTIFISQNYYANIGLSIIGVALLNFARKLYCIGIESLNWVLQKKFHIDILTHSLALGNWEEEQIYFTRKRKS